MDKFHRALPFFTSPCYIAQTKITMGKKIKVIDTADFSAIENLFYEHKGDVVCLHDDVNGELGWFKVWYDSEMEDREYITLNNTIVYLDTIDEL
jgi:hypothetical protein